MNKASAAAETKESADTAERALGRYVAMGLPAASVVAAVGIGAVAGPAPAVLVLAGGALLGTIALLWSSVRTLSGDAPLPEDLEALAARRHGVDVLAEQKGAVLRALKDLDHEHAVGKIDDADFAKLSAEYRERAKEIMRQMDQAIEPLRPRAEQIAKSYLEKRGIANAPAVAAATPPKAAEDAKSAEPVDATPPESDANADTVPRLECAKCGTKNDLDAAFCKKCGASMKATTADAANVTGDADGAA